MALLIGLFDLYQNYQSKQVKWVNGYSCAYWDQKRNDYQRSVDAEVSLAMQGLDFNTERMLENMNKREEAAQIFTDSCLPDSAYFGR